MVGLRDSQAVTNTFQQCWDSCQSSATAYNTTYPNNTQKYCIWNSSTLIVTLTQNGTTGSGCQVSTNYLCTVTGQTRGTNGVCSCPAGQIVINGACANQCTAGATKQISSSLKNASGQMVINIGAGPTLSDTGCQYQCDSNAIDGKTYYNDTDVWQTHMCTATGQSSQSTDTASATVPADAKQLDQPPVPTDSTQPTCQKLPNSGATTCQGGDIPAGCSTIDGIQVCPSSDKVGDSTVKSTDVKNCQRENGVTLCAVDPSKADFCGQVNGVTKCYSKTTETKVTKSTETLPDGTVRETTLEDDGIIGNKPKSTVKETAPNGSVTITTRGGSGAGVDGTDELLKGIDGKLGRIADGLDQGQANGQCKGLECPATFAGTGASDQYAATGRSYQDIVNSFKTRVSSSNIASAATGVFAVSLTGGSCPVWSTDVPIFGVITIDQQCSSVMQSIWPLIYGVILATATFYAIRVAFL